MSDETETRIGTESETGTESRTEIAAGREVVRAPDRDRLRFRTSPQVGDLYEQGGYGRALLSSLVRAQLGLAVAVLAPMFAIVVAIPLAALLWPSLIRVRLAGIPLFLVVLGAGVYPPLVAAGFWYSRRADALEESFADLVEEHEHE